MTEILTAVLKATIVLTKTTAAQNEVALSYRRVRGLYFLAVVFMRSINVIVFTEYRRPNNSNVYILLPLCPLFF